MVKKGFLAGVLAAALVPATAFAADDDDYGTSYDTDETESPLAEDIDRPEVFVAEPEELEEGEEAELEDFEEGEDVLVVQEIEAEDEAEVDSRLDRGVEVQLGGGVVSFPGDVNALGGAYGVALGLEPSNVIGIELGYQGAAYSTDADVVGDNAGERLAGTEKGGYGALKISPFWGGNTAGIEPYALGGIGVSRLDVNQDGGDAAGVLADDTFGKVPVGAGVDVHLGGLTAGVRGTYNFLFNNDEAFQSESERGDDQLLGTVQLGAQF